MGATLGKRIKRPMVPILPKNVTINALCILEDEDADEIICEYLTEEYGYCINNFNFELTELPYKEDNNGPMYKVKVTNIDWDIKD